MNARISTTIRCLAAVLPSLLIAACSVGPLFQQPDAAAPNQFRYQIADFLV